MYSYFGRSIPFLYLWYSTHCRIQAQNIEYNRVHSMKIALYWCYLYTQVYSFTPSILDKALEILLFVFLLFYSIYSIRSKDRVWKRIDRLVRYIWRYWFAWFNIDIVLEFPTSPQTYPQQNTRVILDPTGSHFTIEQKLLFKLSQEQNVLSEPPGSKVTLILCWGTVWSALRVFALGIFWGQCSQKQKWKSSSN